MECVDQSRFQGKRDAPSNWMSHKGILGKDVSREGEA
jgi:hypothetical protein